MVIIGARKEHDLLSPEGAPWNSQGCEPLETRQFSEEPCTGGTSQVKLIPQVTLIKVHLMHLQEPYELLLECPFLVTGLFVFNVMSYLLNL